MREAGQGFMLRLQFHMDAISSLKGYQHAGRACTQEFYAAVPDHSWLTVVQSAAHGTFLDAGFPLNWVFDRLCHHGSASRQVQRYPSD